MSGIVGIRASPGITSLRLMLPIPVAASSRYPPSYTLLVAPIFTSFLLFSRLKGIRIPRGEPNEKKGRVMGEPKDVVHKKNAAFNAHDVDQTMRYFSSDVEMETPIGHLKGREQVGAFFSAFWEAFPDLEVNAIHQTEEGSSLVVRGKVTGTHLGTLRTPGGEIPSTSRYIDLPISDHFEVRGGLIVGVHLYFDRLALLEQLGVAPAPAHA